MKSWHEAACPDALEGIAVARGSPRSFSKITRVDWLEPVGSRRRAEGDLKGAETPLSIGFAPSNERLRMSDKETAIITGASGGIGAGLVEGFLREGYNVVATSRDAHRDLIASGRLALIDGDIGKQQTATQAVEAAISNFGTVDVLVNNAGIFLTRPFTDFTTEDFDALVSTNLLGFFLITQRTVREMVKQRSGCVVTITAALADRPIAGENGSISMMTKGGLNSATQNLAIEYARDGIRFNAVAPGVVDTPMHQNGPSNSTSQPPMKEATVYDIVGAVLYLVRASHVNGEILHIDGGAPARRW
jgi:NAD(P)-dependent dehydrogenase (short-subunit alcohol dehydrogenase family)